MDAGLWVSVIATALVLLGLIVAIVVTHRSPGRPDDTPWQETSGGGGGG
ncbi:MAG: hypothetical protein HOY78_42905 [Saccharothrix sp.]|nr:hypothetical protein [Saccharothrix sp.]